MFWGKIANALHRAPKADVLNFDEEINMAKIIPRHWDPPSSERLFNHSVCQSDDLTPSREWEILESDSDINISGETSTPSASKDSFQRLAEQMLLKSAEKEIQTEEDTYDTEPDISITKIHETLEAQMQTLNELIQDKIVCTIRILDYPVASKAVDKVFDQDSVGFTDAVCFMISTATKSLADDIRQKALSLSNPDVNTLRKKFFKLTTHIESLRKTRVKVFSQFNKQVVALLESMVFNNEFDMDEDRSIFSLSILPRYKDKYSHPMVSEDGSFENHFWGNYSTIMSSLKDDGSWKDPKKLPHGEMELRWEAWNKDKICCRASADKHFYFSQLDARTQLRILFGILDLASTNIHNAECSLKKASQDFLLSKRILKDFSKNIRISTLRSIEIQEILKVLRVSVAMSIIFLKSIEKTTRMSRFFISEGIYSLRGALGETTKKSAQFSYKPNYIALLVTIKCGPGILPILSELEAMSNLAVEAFTPPLTGKTSQNHESTVLVEPELRPVVVTFENQPSLNKNPELVVRPVKEAVLQNNNIPENSRVKTCISLSPSSTPAELEFHQKFQEQIDKIGSLLKHNIRKAYSQVFFPNPATTSSKDITIPYATALCVILLQAVILIQPFREIPSLVRTPFQQTIIKLTKSANFGNMDKKSIIRKLATNLRETNRRLRELAALLLVVPPCDDSEDLANESVAAVNLHSEQEAKDRKWDIFQLRLTKGVGIVVKNTRTTFVENFANLSLKSKCEIILDLAEFVHRILKSVEKDLNSVREDSKIAGGDLKCLKKNLETHLKQHTLSLNNQMYFGRLVARLKQTHKESVVLLGKLSKGLLQVVDILEVLSHYVQVMSVFTHEQNLHLLEQQNINSHHVVVKKTVQVRKYVNDLLQHPLSVQIPLKFEMNKFQTYN